MIDVSLLRSQAASMTHKTYILFKSCRKTIRFGDGERFGVLGWVRIEATCVDVKTNKPGS